LARAFTLIEAIGSVLIVAVMFVAVMATVGAARMSQYKMSGRSRGTVLVQDLMAEILQAAYEDPDTPGAFLGADVSETTSTRADFDDVDDYDGWYASPPQQQDGTVMPDLSGWSRQVGVVWINTSDTGTGVGAETGAKRISVTVKHNGMLMAHLVAVRTSAFPEIDR
jgi:Tfp pilus assembly protein PilV